MTILLAPNPGIAYPERAVRRRPGYERPVHALLGALQRPFVGSSGTYRSIIPKVARHGDAMAELEDGELRARASLLGQRLRRDGFELEPVAETFALVREAATRVLGQRHYDVQLLGAWVMLHGKVAEMDTGEGKTLTATLAAATAALSGLPVHIITANDYLAARDAEEMGPLYRALGLSVGNPVHGVPPPERAKAYASDILYCSNKEITFDFLRDRIALGQRRRHLSVRIARLAEQDPGLDALLLPGLCFALVDEADSVLVDEARTPLIISAPGADGDPDGIYAAAVDLARQLRPERDFLILAKERRVEINDRGRERLQEVAAGLGGIWRGPRRREQLVSQALSALHLFQRDLHYLVRDDKVQIIDEYTGRVLEDRSWEQGLHQMIETKEAVLVTAPKESLARTSYQAFFRRYLHLSGMTGTGRELATELHAVYDLDVVRVPTHRPSRRESRGLRVFADAAAKWSAVTQRVAELHADGRPVLLGARTVKAAEAASQALRAHGLEHAVLSASQDADEAQVIAGAGESGAITVATNMAGRGTDIKLGKGVVERGGLHVLATELHDSRRIDRQLYGRCGRQGDPGSYETWLSLEDELVVTNLSPPVRSFLAGALAAGAEAVVARSLRLAQRRAERRNLGIRRRLLKQDERLEDALAVAGGMDS